MSENDRVTLDAKTLGEMIHELNNIFSIVYGTLEMMIAKTAADDVDKKRILQRTLEQAERVQNVINTLHSGMPSTTTTTTTTDSFT